MFTIKHIDDYGNEVIFSATRVGAKRGTVPNDPIACGVTIEGVVDQEFTSGFYPFRDHREPRTDTGFEAAIFVMNEAGATVAKYLL